jgi:alanyl-tRNA synthetase
LERTSDVGAFIIVSEGSQQAGVRRIEAVTGRGAYELIARRFRALKQTASELKSSVDEVPQKVESLLDEVTDLRKQVSTLRQKEALASLSSQLSDVRQANDVSVLVAEVPDATVETLRTLADRFREKYPQNGAAVFVTGATVLAVLTEDVVKRGIKAADLIAAIGGRGGGRPNMAQGSLPNGGMPTDAQARIAQAITARS